MVELLAPAGSSESLRAAVNAGADAVYIGGSMFGARAYADNPDERALIEGIEFCHIHGRKLYMTVNTLLKEKEIEGSLYDYLLPYYENGVDGLIVQDFGVVQFVQEHFPGLEIHASTQMTVTGAEGARLLQQHGITRVVPARELSLEEIRRIIDETGIEVETFIHGAMCYSYSGQCLFSSMIGGRSGNRGRCAQPCRLPYTLKDKQMLKGGSRASLYLLSMKDMCTLDLIPDLIDCGIASMKIEGRMKRPEYTGGVVSIYRKYIDLYYKYGRKKYRVEEEDRQILMDLYNRGGFSKGYYYMHNGPEMMSMVRPNHYGTEALRVKQVSKGKIKAVALETLHKKDVIELSGGNEITLTQDTGKGETVILSTGSSSVYPGMILNRTKNEWLLKLLEDRFLKENVKEKIKGDLRIYAGGPAILKISNGSFSVEVSDRIAEPAQNNPTPLESVEKQMRKTGNTPFIFEDLQISMEEDLFVSVKQLNELRRKGIEQLTNLILDASRRNSPEYADSANAPEADSGAFGARKNVPDDFTETSDCNKKRRGNQSRSLKMNFLVTRLEQLLSLIEELPDNTDTVYFDTMIFSDYAITKRKSRTDAGPKEAADCNNDVLEAIRILKGKKIHCFISLPPVFRKKDREFMENLERQGVFEEIDGFLLHTIDELSWAREYKNRNNRNQYDGWCKELILAADDNFYTYNRRAAEFLKNQGISRITLPAELNYREMSSLNTEGTELNIYGHQALMHSAQCVTKNTKGCTGYPEVIYIRDRKRAEFPVLNRCNVCCNTIYNSVPLQLGDCKTEIEKLRAGYVRMTFTIESGNDVKQIMKQYTELIFNKNSVSETDLEGTRGHFRRGVE